MAIAKKTNKPKESKPSSLQPKLKKKTTNTKALMALESFIATYKSEIIYDKQLVKLAKLMAREQSQQIRVVFNQINKSGGTVPSDKEIKELFGIGTTETRNVVKTAEAIYSSGK